MQRQGLEELEKWSGVGRHQGAAMKQLCVHVYVAKGEWGAAQRGTAMPPGFIPGQPDTISLNWYLKSPALKGFGHTCFTCFKMLCFP